MTAEPKAVVTRYYQLIETPDQLDEICSPNLLGHAGAGADIESFKAGHRSFREAFPDMHAEVRHLVQEGNIVSTWVSYVGTHLGDFAGVPASGRQIKTPGWDLIHVDEGMITEITSVCDLFTLMNQIGALPTATPA